MNKQAFSLIELSIVLLIIGIILAGITSSSILIDKYRLRKAIIATQSSPVNSISDLALWLETTQENATDIVDPDNMEQITTLKDINIQSIDKKNFTQSDANYKPEFIKKGFNGLPVLNFDKSQYDALYIENFNSSEISSNGQITIFIVFKNNTRDETQVIFSTHDPSNGNQNRIGIELQSDNTLRFDYYIGDDEVTGRLESATEIDNEMKITTFLKNTTTQSIYINGSLYASEENPEPLRSFVSAIRIGEYDPTSFNTDMDLGEFIIFNRALKIEERTAVEEYLSKKWGIALSS